MTASLAYLLLRQFLQMLTQLTRDSGAKDVKILVLRHQLAVLRRPVTSVPGRPAVLASTTGFNPKVVTRLLAEVEERQVHRRQVGERRPVQRLGVGHRGCPPF